MAEHHRACASCGTANEEDARFCEGCGGTLGLTCGTCGVEASATARFCRACGAPLEGQVAQALQASGPSRKTVTVMFADLAGSTTFEEQVDAETAREVMSRYHDLLRSTAERNRAGVTKYIGDGFMAVWGVPEIGPDDADHAVEAAVQLQERFVDFAARVSEAKSVELALRVAVNTGEVVVGAGDADLVGDALNVAARLEAECPRGHVVVGEETWRSTRGRHRYDSLGHVQVKGRNAPVAVYQWLGRQSESTDAAPFVGRADEIRRLATALDDAVTTRAARLVTVIGDPGVGKSRLAAEFVDAQHSGRVIQARCDVEGTVALAPIVELLRARDLDADVPAGVPERDRILRDLNGLAAGVPSSVEETFWALRRFVELLARDGPLVIVVDDLQWADALLLDFVEHLAEWVQEVPVLVLALARPELREVRADLVTVSRWVTEAVHLGGLTPGATAELAASVLGAARLPEELLARLPSSTGGNPLFVRELVGMLVHDGVLVAEPAGWRLTIDVDAIAIPPTIHALLASRLERLNATDRRALEIASVVGTDFSLGTLCALAERGGAEVKASLDRLRRLDIAQPSGAYLGDEPMWRFHHVLIRDVAYRRLLKSDRADLHERLANWVEAGGASVAFDSDEMIARHLEAAHGYRLELGPVDEQTGALALRSARCYLASARRALDRDELISAGTQAARGAALAAADSAIHAELLLIGCEAFLSAGDVAAGAPLVDDLDRIADDALAPWATCYRCQFIVYTDPERLLEVDARLQGAIDEFGRRKDPAGLAKAHRVRAGARGRLGRIGDCEVDLFEALIAARQGGDHRQITAALGAAPSAALWGPSPVPKAGGRCLDVVRMQRMTTAAPSLEATSLRCLAVLELLRGRPDKARSMLADARQIVADLGLRHGLMETELFAGIIESMVGDHVAAEPHFWTAMKGMDALGVGADAGQAAALLARSVLTQGRVDEADRYATESERLAGHNLKTAIAWRAVRAEILAAQGMHDEAVAMADAAVAVAADTDLVLDHADACLALSRVLTAAGDQPRAAAARRDAEALYAAKEAAISIARTIEPPAPATPSPAPATSRFAITNRASQSVEALCLAYRAHDVDRAVALYSDRFVFDDRRRLSGDPVEGAAGLRAAFERILEQYPHFEWRTLSVRGERLVLLWSRWWDDTGNETTYLDVGEIDDDGRITYDARFDEHDFESAYRELERRYYEGEGAAFALNGHVVAEWMAAMDRLDVEAARNLAQPEFRWLATPSALTSGIHSVDDLFGWLEERARQVSSVRHWVPTIRWLSPNCCIGLANATAVGLDSEDYEWTRLCIVEYRDGLLASVRQFELDDEDAAFAYAESLVSPPPNRLTVSNRASEAAEASWLAMQAHDVDAIIENYSDRFVYDDHRRLSGDPIVGITAMRAALERIFDQYSQFELRILAVRGERLFLASSRWSDDAGNETSFLHVAEIANDGRTTYDGRFDADDFEGAFRELELRYYAGEGAAFAEAGAVATAWMIALNQNDFDRAFGELCVPELHIQNRSSSAFPDRSAAETRTTLEELNTMVASVRTWHAVVCWLSPSCVVLRQQREGIGPHGEDYEWLRVHVCEFRDGRVASVCEFDPDDEDAAFAYAETLVTPRPSRLAVSNRASQTLEQARKAMQANDAHTTSGFYADRLTYDDRRRISGDPIDDRAGLERAAERILAQYNRFEARTLAVRGEFLHLAWNRWTDDAGNEATNLRLIEIDDDDRITYEGRFDEDDFEGAYRELERRYYAGEGAAYAESGATTTEVVVAHNRGDLETVFGELTDQKFRLENRSRSAFPDRSAAELRASTEELQAMFSSVRMWYSAVCWLSPNWAVARQDREAVGPDGANYQWVQLYASEIKDGLATSTCAFDLEDEDAAFAYAEEHIRAASSRLTVTNRVTEVIDAVHAAYRSRDIDASVDIYADQFVYDDRRRLSGDPIEDRVGLLAATRRLWEQYSAWEARTLAVRGERLALWWSRWSDDSGNESTYLHVFEVNDDDRIVYAGRFDEDDFESAYRELEQRYYAGEGAAFTEAGSTLTDFVMAMNRGDLDQVFGEFATPDASMENRSRSVFGDRSAEEYRASIEELRAMVASVRVWWSALCWLSPTWLVLRTEREAVGQDGEQYTWTKAYTLEIRGGRPASMCEFEPDDEESAFAYAEERMRATSSRLVVTNRATEVAYRGMEAMQARDIEAQVAVYSDQLVYDDRRRLGGHPIENPAELRAAVERIHQQYSVFEARTLAVRGERLHLASSRWSDEAGNVTVQLHVQELGDDERIACEVRFDEDDFESAYRELEQRYYAGEGAAFAEAGATATDWVTALNRGDFDRAFDELSTPDLRVENRSRALFPDRSAAELRTSFEQLSAIVASSRMWLSAAHWVSPAWVVVRLEREAVGKDGEDYRWLRVHVCEFQGGRLATVCQFELEDEQHAFAYAEERAQAAVSRLAVTNQSCEFLPAFSKAVRAHDVDGSLMHFSDRFVLDDHRRLSGDPIVGLNAMRAAIERVFDQYTKFEIRVLAVRGQRLHLLSTRWSDDDGNETTTFYVNETGDDGRISYHAHFDEDDFDGAYRELERRYYAGEGATFAESGAVNTDYMIAMNRGDFDTMFGELSTPDMHVQNRSRSVFPDRSAAELRASLEELNAMVASTRNWQSALLWLSPNWAVGRQQREAVGLDGERYEWTRFLVAEYRDGRLASLCDFDVEDEAAAYAYAEERVQAASSRLAVTNRASEVAANLATLMQRHEVVASIAAFSDQFVYDDRRRLSGDLIEDRAELRAALERVFEQFTDFDWHTLAVRGERLVLFWSRWSDDAGNETTTVYVFELGADSRIGYMGRFDEDDFEDAYLELERRYYAGEGAEFAGAGEVSTGWITALNRGDLDRIFDEFIDPEMHVVNRSRSPFPDGSASEFRAALGELHAMVASARSWVSAASWLSPAYRVARWEREAVGRDGEQYAWARIMVTGFRDRRVVSMCEFDIEDEEGAFAYAEERMRAASSRLAVSNRSCETVEAAWLAMRAHDVDALVAFYSDPFEYDDRRRLSGGPRDTPDALRAAVERLLEQYPHFEWRTLAVRGERLGLHWSRWWDDAGNEAAHLHVFEIGDDGRVTYDGRFDEDDFESAYRELERRYYAGEGAAFAGSGGVTIDWMTALNRGDLDRLFGDLTVPDMRVENRSRSAFPHGSAGDLRASIEELAAMVASARRWFSAVCWVSEVWSVARFEQEAVGKDGEKYAWTRLMVSEVRDERLASICELEDEVAAFAYAEERLRAPDAKD